jgi:hypothetical protein
MQRKDWWTLFHFIPEIVFTHGLLDVLECDAALLYTFQPRHVTHYFYVLDSFPNLPVSLNLCLKFISML